MAISISSFGAALMPVVALAAASAMMVSAMGCASSHDHAMIDYESHDASVLRTLDAFHAAAARADGAAYFRLFADDGVFIGTDASEHWTVAEFRAYAEPYFSQGKGWVYTPRAGSRHVTFSSSGDVAWFDELLDSASYGTSRGTGVMVYKSGEWKIAQYALTFPIPNDLAKELTARIAAFERAATKP
jgi:ketosteroid isomerase-like protein